MKASEAVTLFLSSAQTICIHWPVSPWPAVGCEAALCLEVVHRLGTSAQSEPAGWWLWENWEGDAEVRGCWSSTNKCCVFSLGLASLWGPATNHRTAC